MSGGGRYRPFWAAALTAMQLPDVNVLIYAHRQDTPEHHRYASWLKGLVEAPEPFAVAEIVLAGFLRIITDPKIFQPATPMPTAG